MKGFICIRRQSPSESGRVLIVVSKLHVLRRFGLGKPRASLMLVTCRWLSFKEFVSVAHVDRLLRGCHCVGLGVLLLLGCDAEAGIRAGGRQRGNILWEGFVREAGMETIFFDSTVRGVLGPQEPHIFHLCVHTLPPLPPPLLRAVKGSVTAVDVWLVLGPLPEFSSRVLKFPCRGAWQVWRQAVWVWFFQYFGNDAGGYGVRVRCVAQGDRKAAPMFFQMDADSFLKVRWQLQYKEMGEGGDRGKRCISVLVSAWAYATLIEECSLWHYIAHHIWLFD